MLAQIQRIRSSGKTWLARASARGIATSNHMSTATAKSPVAANKEPQIFDELNLVLADS